MEEIGKKDANALFDNMYAEFLEYAKTIPSSPPSYPGSNHPWVGRYVVIRCYASGAHCGFLLAYDPVTRHAFVGEDRIIYNWSEQFTLHGVAVNGLEKAQMSTAASENLITDVIGITPCTDEVAKNLRELPTYTETNEYE